MLETRKVHVLL